MLRSFVLLSAYCRRNCHKSVDRNSIKTEVNPSVVENQGLFVVGLHCKSVARPEAGTGGGGGGVNQLFYFSSFGK